MVFKCQVDGRVFKTSAALAQHKRDRHTAGMVPRPVVIQQARGRPAQRGGASRATARTSGLPTQQLVGVDLLSIADLSSGVAAGNVLRAVTITPSGFPGSRLSSHAALWARWRPRRLRVKLIVGGGFTTFGLLTVGYSPEPNFTLGEPAENLRRVTSMRPSATTNTSSPIHIDIPCDTSRKWYLCRGDLDDSCHGVVVVVVSAATGGWNGHLTVNMQVDWEVEFEGAEMLSQAPGQLDAIAPDAGYSHLFTTSDGAWDPSVLTFKMHSGGSMVPWSAAKPSYIYGPAPGVEITYIDEANVKRHVHWAVRIQNYTTPGLAFCASAADAIEYVRTGNLKKLIPYHAPSDFAIPDVVRLVGRPAASYSLSSPSASIAAPESLLDERVQRLEQQVEKILGLLSASRTPRRTSETSDHSQVRESKKKDFR